MVKIINFSARNLPPTKIALWEPATAGTIGVKLFPIQDWKVIKNLLIYKRSSIVLLEDNTCTSSNLETIGLDRGGHACCHSGTDGEDRAPHRELRGKCESGKVACTHGQANATTT